MSNTYRELGYIRNGVYSRILLVTLLLIIVVITTLWATIGKNETGFSSEIASDNGRISTDGFTVSMTFPELIDSEIIVIGTIGPVVARDYPGRHQLHFNDMSDMSESEIEEWILLTRDVYHQIEIEEIWKGRPELPFVLGYPDVEYALDSDYYDWSDTLPLEEGQRVVIFADKDKEPELYTDKLEVIYGAFADDAIFDIDDQNRAFPRTPEIFDELTTEEGFYIGGDELQSYFDLGKLKLTIERVISEREAASESS